jgi:hypothetical protein
MDTWPVRRGPGLLILCLLAIALLAGCGSASDETARPQKSTSKMPSRGFAKDRASEEVAPSHCPSGVPECRTAEGRIVYVERVDPDGDGDAHFVISDPQGITLPGVTAIDVRKGLRPHPLPGAGDLISAAGPVQTGSYGQSQIHALELHVAR